MGNVSPEDDSLAGDLARIAEKLGSVRGLVLVDDPGSPGPGDNRPARHSLACSRSAIEKHTGQTLADLIPRHRPSFKDSTSRSIASASLKVRHRDDARSPGFASPTTTTNHAPELPETMAGGLA